MVPAGRVVTVEFSARVPQECTEEQLQAWVEFNLFAIGVLDNTNPNVNEPLEAIPFSVEVR